MDTAIHTRTPESSLEKIFRPRSLAVIGASPQQGSVRNLIVRTIIKHGFEGPIYPVTPSHPEIEGMKAYKRIGDIPEVPDLALIVTPASTVAGIIDECGAKGVKHAIVYSAGFEEIEGGKIHAKNMREAAQRNGVAVLGPNCQGVWSVKAKTIPTFGAAAYALESIRHAPIAIVSQSGALAGAMGNYLQKNNLGCSYIVSVGNETCLDAIDALAWLIEQDDVRVVGLYLEGLDNAGRLLELAARARARGVQIVTLKAGRSAFGQEATASHTGKIASPYSIYLDVLAQAGVIIVNGLGDMMAALEVLSFIGNPRRSGDPKGGVAILSASGGAGALLADHSEEMGVPMAEFSTETVEKLDAILPEFARKENPVDLTGHIRANPNLFRDSIALLEADKRVEAIIVQFTSSGLRDLRENAAVFRAAAKEGGMPVVISFSVEMADPAVKTEFLNDGILLSDNQFNTMRALKFLYDRRDMAELRVSPRNAAIVDRKAPSGWEETMSFLDEAGVPPAKWTILGPEDKAADACADLNWPLVVKVLPSESDHKTELGLVKLRVQTPEAVDTHAADFRRILGKPHMGVLVQEMITDGVEVVLSCLRKTDFGPILSIGTGGIAIELFRDITYLALPVTHEQVRAALQKLKLWTLLEGFRGAPRADIEALVAAAVKFGDIVLATPDLVEAEINPVLVRPEGKGLAAVDFLGTVDGDA